MSDDVIDKLAKLSQSAAVKLNVKSALNPMLWLCAITMPIFFGMAYLFRDSKVLEILVIAGCVPPGCACLAFCYFAIFKPEKLQSEDYQIRHESLQIIQQKGGKVIAYNSTIEAIANPYISKKLQEEKSKNA